MPPGENQTSATRSSHPLLPSSDAAAPAVLGYKVITIYHDESGLPDLEALKRPSRREPRPWFATNPEDTGIFNPRIDEFTKIVHQHGGLCTYDQANANGILA